MKIDWLPKRREGKLSLILLLLEILLLAYFFVMTGVFHQTGGETFFSNLNLTIPMLGAWTAGLISFVLGLIAVFHYNSHSIVLYITILLTFLTTLYGILAVLP